METGQTLTDGVVTLRRADLDPPAATMVLDITTPEATVGRVWLTDVGDGVGRVRWDLAQRYRGRKLATHALRLCVDYGLGELDFTRIETLVPPDQPSTLRTASRSGLRREGVRRAPRTPTDPDTGDLVVLARLRDDPEPTAGEGFRALLNSALPRKRAIAQLAIRDTDDRLLLCQLTYKADWDLPGGVVEDDESPRAAAEREVAEELGLDIRAQRLLAVDWLPAWGGWDDACLFVFDGGVHDSALTDRIRPQPREIRTAAFCSRGELVDRAADFTARRARAILDGNGDVLYLEGGRLLS